MKKLRKSLIFKKLILFLLIFFVLIAFNLQDSRNGGWTRQFFPVGIGTNQIQDITFTDSLTGYAITHDQNLSDTSFILKTTDAGNNWVIIRTIIPQYNGLYKLSFLNNDTGFIASFIGISPNFSNIQKTINGGINWENIYLSPYISPSDLFVLNIDTMWICSPRPVLEGGGLYRSTNGGLNWTVQYTPGIGGANGYSKFIYMYNRNMGFLGTDEGELLKTTNSGVNWTIVLSNIYYQYFSDMYFVDSLKGYLANGYFFKTTNGGMNWKRIDTLFPFVPGGFLTGRGASHFSFKNDTIYAVGGSVEYPNYSTRGLIFKSTNGGLNWGYQIPDTSWGIGTLNFVNFINGKTGWTYQVNNVGLRTFTGGDTTFYAGILNSGNLIFDKYLLFQNYPNPFNPISNIKYKIEKTSSVKIIVFDIAGKQIKTLISKKQSAGIYEVKFNGSNISSGIYFYSLYADGVRVDTKKMILLK